MLNGLFWVLPTDWWYLCILSSKAGFLPFKGEWLLLPFFVLVFKGTGVPMLHHLLLHELFFAT